MSEFEEKKYVEEQAREIWAELKDDRLASIVLGAGDFDDIRRYLVYPLRNWHVRELNVGIARELFKIYCER